MNSLGRTCLTLGVRVSGQEKRLNHVMLILQHERRVRQRERKRDYRFQPLHLHLWKLYLVQLAVSGVICEQVAIILAASSAIFKSPVSQSYRLVLIFWSILVCLGLRLCFLYCHCCRLGCFIVLSWCSSLDSVCSHVSHGCGHWSCFLRHSLFCHWVVAGGRLTSCSCNCTYRGTSAVEVLHGLEASRKVGAIASDPVTIRGRVCG